MVFIHSPPLPKPFDLPELPDLPKEITIKKVKQYRARSRAKRPSTKNVVAYLPTEILCIIFGYLHQGDLLSCVKVCREWGIVCPPHIWRSVKLGTPSNRRFFKSSLGERLLAVHAGHIQELEVHNPQLLRHLFAKPVYPTEVLPRWHRMYHIDLTSPLCTRLKELTLGAKLRRDRSVPMDPATLARSLVRYSPRLRTLEMTSRQHTRVRNDLVLAGKRLKHLRIDVPMTPISIKKLLRCVPSSIKSVKMYCDQFPDDDQVSSDDGKNDKHDKENQKRRQTAMVSKMRKHPKLKSLHLLRDFSGWEEDVLLRFLQSCKKGVFKDFQVENTFCYSSADLVSAFAGLGMHLETFRDTDPPSGEDAEDEDLAEVISMNPHLKAIFFRKVETAGPFTVVAIMQCQHLKALDLQGCLNLSSQDLLQILGSAGNLEQF